MNSMVGASVHTSVSDGISELLKSDRDMGEIGVEDEGGDETTCDLFATDDFDPEELLKSPLFNNSAEKLTNNIYNENSFGTFEDDMVDDSEQQKRASTTSSSSHDFRAQLGYGRYQTTPPKAAAVQQFSAPMRTQSSESTFTESSYDSRSPPPDAAYEVSYPVQMFSQEKRSTQCMVMKDQLPQVVTPVHIPYQNIQQEQYQLSPQGGYLTNQQAAYSSMPNEKANYATQNDQAGYGMQNEQVNNYMSMQVQQNMNSSYDSPIRSSSEHGGNYASPVNGGAYSEQRMQPTMMQAQQGMNFGVPHQSNPLASMPYSTPMQGMLPRSTSYRSPPSAQSSSYSAAGPQETASMSQLQEMQQYVQHMQGGSGLLDNPGLSQTMHGQPYGRTSSTGLRDPLSMSQSMHERSHSFHGSSGYNPAFAGIANHTNVSVAVDVQGEQSMEPGHLNDAMEKLCESMKRSAMSRSLVKQFSGRSLARQSSARGVLSRQNSGRMGMNKQLSNRSLMARQDSNRSLIDDASGRGTPTAVVPIRRLSNAKHHLQHPGRGVYRHNSLQSLSGLSNHGISLHLDGRNMGQL